MRPVEIPLVPDGDEARDWAERELQRPEYAAAQPTPLDRIATAIRDFFDSIFGAQAPPGLGGVVLVGFAVLVVALVIVAFVVWGRPRAIRRASTPFAPLFGADDTRTAVQLRGDAEAAARAAEWGEAIILRTRAIARGLQERGLVDLPPGATVHAFARAAGAVFTAHRSALDGVADAFDDVRYLRREGTRERYETVVRTDELLVSARAPQLTGAAS